MTQVSTPKPHEKLKDLLALVDLVHNFSVGNNSEFNTVFTEFVENGNQDYKEKFIEIYSNLNSTKMKYSHKGVPESAIRKDVTARANHIDSFRDWSGIEFVHSMISAYWQDREQVATDPYGLFEYVIKTGLLELPEKYGLPLDVINKTETLNTQLEEEGSLEDEAFHFMSVLNLFERITNGKLDDNINNLNVKYVLKTGSEQHGNTIHNNNSVFREFASDKDLLKMIDTYR